MKLRNLIVETLKEEVVPAMGCTEPVAVALACAKAKELMAFNYIESAKVFVSPNIYKNGLSVGIPNTKEVGLHIAAALGFIGGESEKDLRVLEGINERQVQLAKELLHSGKVSLDIKDTEDKIYVEVNLVTDKGNCNVIISGKHNRFVYIERLGEVLLDLRKGDKKSNIGKNILYGLKVREIISEIEKIPHEDIAFMLDGVVMNEAIAEVGLKEKMGMGVGFSLKKGMEQGFLCEDLMTSSMMLTAAASDARMSGINLSVMSSNGSGNNGLTAILPLVAYKNKFNVTDEKLAKAVAISHIMNSYIKHYIGRLSALCACGVAAGTGSGVAIAWLMGASEEQIDGVIKNTLANTSGMICDGAKEGCALKLSTSASVAVQSAVLAINGSIVPARNGIVAETAEDTIMNLGVLSSEGMNIADVVILNTMKKMQKEFETLPLHENSKSYLKKQGIIA
ncbi:L-serine ammonia-lyase, iron-sulfur-dependent, subunit alpha [Clostridium tagluense]|uniref:L-cysteine desulfidase family protein n=1 Tax=Clostridium TaxID=1485 RepID=UPI0013E9256D|nr:MULTISPECIES: L-serine ammonia-lyase, iron-sulfur-dependent, subunit alpha [Clostridium]MBU3126964.1 L-serine ammonia-lyase, iron-sulfur-dependent, subunit alpha [Clostridium tagluense]MBW9155560.1 L-serine ammonia-lyase, iron-sulfur-dependent, subunit alpha [Clostridium tagluense]MBZ9625376.1 L-serine ammonia-lyase, iron-sulfur-dependent, subunit alpha [Clostridium sp. FP2]MCB2314073.1 L-serine ammonia-lyase, iron-sulfur-dependent, subunit alpha [Clostridium tagluense]MCB2318910.1 L-serine